MSSSLLRSGCDETTYFLELSRKIRLPLDNHFDVQHRPIVLFYTILTDSTDKLLLSREFSGNSRAFGQSVG